MNSKIAFGLFCSLILTACGGSSGSGFNSGSSSDSGSSSSSDSSTTSSSGSGTADDSTTLTWVAPSWDQAVTYETETLSLVTTPLMT
ncbi:hypothetical protein [Oceanobacter mangrovi]|uniref:hypothetical protein n=1 Tax=Oceanobacter mangrovi TaxID=2862510 RepID=UPI001C8EA603|nr:hypothetical protein [Oceanobacter mangrovi]